MFTRHVSRRLAPYIDGELDAAGRRGVEDHLAACATCRLAYGQVRIGIESLDRLPAVAAPETIWVALEAALAEQRPYPARTSGWRWAFAAAAVVVMIAAAWWIADLDAGKWIVTDAATRARVAVGSIGYVDVEPNTRIRLLKDRPEEHRFQLAHGTIHATITAPPRLFFVNTASAVAVDLGCEYTLSTDDNGSGLLRVTRGWVAFEWKGLESLVPAGAMCHTRPSTGPGIPYFEDAPESLQQAVDGGPDGLNAILEASRIRDTLTLWHLLQRVDPADRGRVYDRIAALTPVPAGVSRDRALALDPETLKLWKDELAWTW